MRVLLLVALPVQFLTVGWWVSKGRAMKFKAMLISVGLALVLVGVAVGPRRASAQDSEIEAGKRKIRVKVTPTYPAVARQMNVYGRVKIEATVAADGRVVATRVVGGSPLLVMAALDAIKKFQFEPGPKDTTETVEFQFDR
jgi:TonB family protein